MKHSLTAASQLQEHDVDTTQIAQFYLRSSPLHLIQLDIAANVQNNNQACPPPRRNGSDDYVQTYDQESTQEKP